MSDRQSRRMESGEFVHRVLVVVGVAAGVGVLLALVWAATDTLLLLFGGILLGVFLCGLTDLVARHTPLSPGWSLALVLVTLAALVLAGGWVLAAEGTAQFDQLARELPQALGQLEDQLRSYAWGERLLNSWSVEHLFARGRGNLFGQITGVFSTALGALSAVVVILFVGLYLAIDPGLYQRGLVRLVPLDRRPRALEVCAAVGQTLRYWLLGRLVSMTLVGVATTVGLAALGIPFPLALGVLAFVLDFVPYLGPIVAAVPAVLLALTLGPAATAWVVGLYAGVQAVESYIVTPLVQQKAAELPPVLTIGSQVVLGALLGVLGIIFATPLTAAGLVLVKMLYVEDTLGDPITAKEEAVAGAA